MMVNVFHYAMAALIQFYAKIIFFFDQWRVALTKNCWRKLGLVRG